jgi:GAF domain-containing protein/anti-sigma regulatory factor (Ser/Thr protein kinase)
MKRLEPRGTKSRPRKPPPAGAGANSVMRAIAEAEALEQNKAITDILRVISSSPAELQPVFDTILSHAKRLCEGNAAVLWQYDGTHLQVAAEKGGNAEVLNHFRDNPLAPGNYNPTPEAALERRTVHVLDVFDNPRYRPLVPPNRFGTVPNAGTVLAVPLLRGEELLGVISIWRFEKQLFTDKQVAMVEAFAAQAAIAIHNVRLHNETKEALEQQTATADILRVISGSPTDIQPVLHAVAENAARLCQASNVHIRLVNGDLMPVVVQVGPISLPPSAMAQRISPTTVAGRAIIERGTIHIHDVMEASVRSEYPDGAFLKHEGDFRTLLVVPLLRDASAIGTITIRRAQMQPFSPQHIKLLETFAAQAVIAIENVRLFNETKEALAQQTATAEILRVIGASMTDTKPVFEAIVKSCESLFKDSAVTLRLVRDGSLQVEANVTGTYLALPINRESVVGACVLDARSIHLPDLEAAVAEFPRLRELGLKRGYRSGIYVPLLRGGSAIGTISVLRRQLGAFSDKELALLHTFADQAVIAIENVRLFHETKEALERQTASAEVLRVISGTPADAQPVFDAIAQSALRVFKVSHVGINVVEGDVIKVKATRGSHDPRGEFGIPLDRNSTAGRSVLDRALIEVEDTESQDVASFTRDSGRLVGFRAIATAPMLREGTAVGSVSMMRSEPGAFSGKQLELLQTFADQAAIAIENARLFNELQTTNASLREALEQQTATGDILKVISRSTTNVQPVFETIIRNAVRLCDGTFGMLWQSDGKVMDVGADYNFSPQSRAEFRRAFPHPLGTDTPAGQAIVENRVVNLPDIHETAYSAAVKDRARTLGYRSVLVVPMMRDDEPIGAIAITRSSVGVFADSHVALLKTFADQAVIAIENVRLFNETKEALEQQTAISEILRVISDSPTDVMPVLRAVAERAARICEAQYVDTLLVDGNVLRQAACIGEIGRPEGETRPLDRTTVMGRAVIDRVPVHIEDLLNARQDEFPLGRELAAKLGHRTTLGVPLLREQQALGVILLRRTEVRPFTTKQIALLKTFANQAAIAIENVRLFNETEEALTHQTATAEVLKTISRSTFDLQAVLQALVDNAAQLSGATRAVMHRPDANGVYAPVVTFNYETDPLLLARLREHPIRPGRDSINGRALLERRPIHVADVLNDREYGRQDLAKAGGFRTVLSVPMLRDGEVIGLISLTKGQEVDPFTDKQIELVTTFADQAVIAIENVRLFNEIQEKSVQLEVANKHKSDFLANMSHELRTPLNAIIGFSEALMEKMFGELNEKQGDYLKDIHESGKHLLALINDILDLSKIEAGRMDLEVSSFHLPTALSNAMTLIRERAQRHAIELGLDVDERLGEFQADERKFKQIMLNLLSNAVKFTPDGGRVDVCAKKDTDKIEIAVKDTGIGIAPEDQAAVFEEFKQVGRDQLRKAEGTGLGLALTRRFVELHGGAIRLESTPGKGSTFTVCLPIRN